MKLLLFCSHWELWIVVLKLDLHINTISLIHVAVSRSFILNWCENSTHLQLHKRSHSILVFSKWSTSTCIILPHKILFDSDSEPNPNITLHYLNWHNLTFSTVYDRECICRMHGTKTFCFLHDLLRLPCNH